MVSKLKVLTYNLWHGLSGSGTVRFGELEPKERRQKRFQLQISELRKCDADLIFLQEVNPLYKRSAEIANALAMDFVAQYDQAGIKILGFGIPINLSTGLTILAKPMLKIKKVKGLKLSGGFGFCSRLMSFQISEFRYALFAQIEVGEASLHLANVHLHHGPVIGDLLNEKLDEFFLNHRELSNFKIKLLENLKAGEQRRYDESKKLLGEFKEIKSAKILCGDLNVEPGHALLELYRQAGLKDTFSELPGNSWDENENIQNHLLTRNLKLTVPVGGSHVLGELFRDYDARTRRIDYIMTSREMSAEDSKLVMTNSVDGLIGSDHFGLQTVLSF
jgi:endonuclease/exonuclease/phosphatase family metal-dependent hydrolase